MYLFQGQVRDQSTSFIETHRLGGEESIRGDGRALEQQQETTGNTMQISTQTTWTARFLQSSLLEEKNPVPCIWRCLCVFVEQCVYVV